MVIYAPTYQEDLEKKLMFAKSLGINEIASAEYVAKLGQGEDLNEFFFNNGLLEFPLKGCKYAYAFRNGRKQIRIDRIVTCATFRDIWPDSCYTTMAFPVTPLSS
ncbi:hypothetical protein QVD17_39439 [Tagetes erecta]|uniref:Uncharacterized protein n=1 Tax=Tagetes erecta TaxID=13708 RepID=A0AAD8JNK1_TARER|nr:hypothetical protein QVD17_39439 [Tagetes erecta]